MYSIERVDLPCVETTREAFFFVTPTGDSPRDPRAVFNACFNECRGHGPAGLPGHVSWFRGGTKNLQYHPNEVSFSLPWRPGAPAPAAPWSFFSPRGLLQAFSRYRFRLALLLRFKNTRGAGTHRTPVKRHRGEPGLTGSNSAVAPVVASVVLTFTRYTRSARFLSSALSIGEMPASDACTPYACQIDASDSPACVSIMNGGPPIQTSSLIGLPHCKDASIGATPRKLLPTHRLKRCTCVASLDLPHMYARVW